jgi:hypothetical protein
MAKAEIILNITIDTETEKVDYDVISAIDGDIVCWEKQTERSEVVAEKDSVTRYSQILYGKDGQYTQAVPMGYIHDLLAKAIKPIAEDEKKRFGIRKV